MRKALLIAGIFALTAAFSPTAVLAKGKGGMHHSAKGNAHHGGMHHFAKGSAHHDGRRSLARADMVAGTHGLHGRNIARTRGANSPGFCPPGQAKKPGLGSRFAC